MFSYPNKERRAAWIRQVVAAGRQSAEENAGIELPIYILHGTASGNSKAKTGTNVALETDGSYRSESSLNTLSCDSNRQSTNDHNPQVSVTIAMSKFPKSSRESSCRSSDAQRDDRQSQGKGSNFSIREDMYGISIAEETTSQESQEDCMKNSENPLVNDFKETIEPGVTLGGIVLGGVVLAAVGDELEEGMSNESSDEASEEQPDVIEIESAVSSTLPQYSGGVQVSNDRPSMYLKRYYDMMYYSGIIAHNIGRKRHVEGCSCSVLSGTFQKEYMSDVTSLNEFSLCAFWMLSTLSAFDSFCQVKYNFMLAVSKDKDVEYSTFVYIAFYLAEFIAKLYILFIFFFNKEKTDKMFHSMENYENIYHSNRAQAQSSWKIILVSALALSTFVMAGKRGFLYAAKFDAKDVILKSCQELVEDLTIWNPDTMENDTVVLRNELGDNITSSRIALGIALLLRSAASDLQTGMIFDLVIVVCTAMNMFTIKFAEEIKAITENVPREHLEERNHLQVRRELTWKKYRLLKSIFADVNDIFDPIFKLLHMRNLLSYAFFMAHIFLKSFSWIFLLLFAVNLVKAEVGYYMAGNISQVNNAIRVWIRNWGEETGKIVVDGVEKDAVIQLDELSMEPIGLGKGIFLIHQTFHYKFMGLVGSVFFSMADEQKS